MAAVMKMTDYKELKAQLQSLIEGVPYRIANLANASALLWQGLEGLNWAGFYLREGDGLVLGPFQGKPACIRIPLSRGVCGAAARTMQTQRVEDVHAFPGHIACDCASNSEIVVPILRGGETVAVLDLDSPLFGRFTPEDQAGLEAFARVLEEAWGDMR
jgi:GAF domain-containing protein